MILLNSILKNMKNDIQHDQENLPELRIKWNKLTLNSAPKAFSVSTTLPTSSCILMKLASIDGESFFGIFPHNFS